MWDGMHVRTNVSLPKAPLLLLGEAEYLTVL